MIHHRGTSLLALFSVLFSLSSYAASYKGASGSKRFGLTPNLGLTGASYNEEAAGIKFVQWGLTGKVTFRFSPIINVFDIDLNTYLTLVPLTINPSTVTPTRFSGFNGRVGYHLPFEISNFGFVVSVGEYYWQMLVSDQSYGLNAWGPQGFFVIHWKGDAHPWAIYIKYALLSAGTSSYVPGNGEVAVGGKYRITRIWGETPLGLTIDVAQLRLDQRQVSLFSASGGLQLEF